MVEPLASEHETPPSQPMEPMAPQAGPRLGTVAATFSRRLAKTPNIAALLGVERVIWWPTGRASQVDSVLGWGEKRNTARAKRFAARHRVPFIRLEDGFLRSVDLGVSGDPPLSIVLDDVGIYYDARSPSRLENLLASSADGDPLADEALLERADQLIEAIQRSGLSKYNNAPPAAVDLGQRVAERVLVVDQTAGDLSITYGMASAASFEAMLAAAIAENPDAEILVKTHPDVIAGKKQGHLAEAADRAQVTLLDQAIAPIDLLRQVDKVYVVSSQLGFEALLADVPVVCFGVPFYAGWGLTDDRGPTVARRTRKRTVREVFAAAYLLYCQYLDPNTAERGDAEDVVGFLAEQRRQFARNTGRHFCIGFSSWKHNFIRAYLRCPGNEVRFVSSASAAEALGFDRTSHLITWGGRGQDEALELVGRYGVPRWRMEDAFLRSVGLGSDLTTPASLVLDREGIYYNPNASSELERICESRDFTADDVERASRLRERIIASRISKYNVGRAKAIEVPPGKRLVLVPGQVEDDASIELGCVDVRTNLGLLEAAREARPDAYLLWKPHPDVVSGNRRGAVPPEVAKRYADRIEDDISLADCLAASDEVHTMTSLVGFEGLMRDVDVVVYGLPFYAGWGLTSDRHTISRRSQALTIDELCAAVLIRYPRYVHPMTLRFSTPEATLDLLAAARDADRGASRLKLAWPRRQARKLVNVVTNMVKELTRAP